MSYFSEVLFFFFSIKKRKRREEGAEGQGRWRCDLVAELCLACLKQVLGSSPVWKKIVKKKKAFIVYLQWAQPRRKNEGPAGQLIYFSFLPVSGKVHSHRPRNVKGITR